MIFFFCLPGVMNIAGKIGEASSNVLDVTNPNATETSTLKSMVGDTDEAKQQVSCVSCAIIFISFEVFRALYYYFSHQLFSKDKNR